MNVKNHAFTIVELLVVIVVIAILATITIVSYTGISNKAVASALQSDLDNASKALKLFQVDNSAYPSTISTNCSTTPTTTTNLCLKLSNGNNYIGYSANNSSNSQSFLLITSNSTTSSSTSLTYKITNSTSPTQLATTMQPGVTPGAILELRAAKANNGLSQGINSPLTTTWTDTSGNGNNGTLTGYAANPWSGYGTLLDPNYLVRASESGNVTVTGNSNFRTSTFTAEQWVWNAGNDTNYRTFLNFLYGSGSNTYGFAIMRYSTGWTGVLGAYIGRANISGWSYLNWASDPAPIGSWTHVVTLYDGIYGDVYINNTRKVHTAFVYAPVPDSINLNMTVNGESYPGSRVSITRLYPFALNSSQLQTNYNNGPN